MRACFTKSNKLIKSLVQSDLWKRRHDEDVNLAGDLRQLLGKIVAQIVGERFILGHFTWQRLVIVWIKIRRVSPNKHALALVLYARYLISIPS